MRAASSFRQAGVNNCVAQGLAVIQGDADADLVYYPDLAFDYAILSQTIQATYSPRDVLEQLLRIGKRAIVSFPNFGHWRVRTQLMFRGKMPKTDNLPDRWYDTPNIHLCTIKDFLDLCRDAGAKVERVVALNASGSKLGVSMPLFAAETCSASRRCFCCRGELRPHPEEPSSGEFTRRDPGRHRHHAAAACSALPSPARRHRSASSPRP